MDLTAVLAGLTELESDEGLAAIARFLRDVAEDASAATLPEVLAAVQTAIGDRRTPVETSLVDLDFDEGWGDWNTLHPVDAA